MVPKLILLSTMPSIDLSNVVPSSSISSSQFGSTFNIIQLQKHKLSRRTYAESILSQMNTQAKLLNGRKSLSSQKQKGLS